MKQLVLVTAIVLSAYQAKADGFICDTVSGDLTVKVFNHTSPEEGTRNGAVMILSNPEVEAGSKTIARFTDINGRLTNAGAEYVADVDLRFSDSSRKGELVGGTKLGNLDQVILRVKFSYAEPVAAKTAMSGKLFLVRRVGETIEHDVVCSRYLKN